MNILTHSLINIATRVHHSCLPNIINANTKDEKKSQKAHIFSKIGKYIPAWRTATNILRSDV